MPRKPLEVEDSAMIYQIIMHVHVINMHLPIMIDQYKLCR